MLGLLENLQIFYVAENLGNYHQSVYIAFVIVNCAFIASSRTILKGQTTLLLAFNVR